METARQLAGQSVKFARRTEQRADFYPYQDLKDLRSMVPPAGMTTPFVRILCFARLVVETVTGLKWPGA